MSSRPGLPEAQMRREPRLLLLGRGGHALAGGDGARNVQPEQRDHCGDQRTQGEGIEPARQPRQGGEADIDAVEVAEEISQDGKGQDAQIDLAYLSSTVEAYP